ncbi:hypothetical protein [Streptomyces sp. YU58]|uniref:hypothetical protein n=1 Tax=Streptomyces sp. SX92 TaxID=3158972 RepID=UPI0027B9235B|nr:hypothetical protein [Streptomyces coralus]WLW52752.1 hypothetical protein QU709_15755 [Streptomyces coralus]
MTTNEPGINISGGIHGGTFAFGDNNRVESHHGTGAQRDAAAEELLAAVRELRADLTRMRASDETTALDEALAETEDDLTRTGRATPTRLDRLRQILGDSQALVTLVASAGALTGLLGM